MSACCASCAHERPCENDCLRQENQDFERVTSERVREPLIDEIVEQVGTVEVDFGFPEEWEVLVTKGKAPPYGYVDSGRVLIGPTDDPLAGLVWSKEHGKKYIHQVWVDPEARGQKLGKKLVDIYKKEVSKDVVFQGPFSPGGLALAKSVKAKIKKNPSRNSGPRKRKRKANVRQHAPLGKPALARPRRAVTEAQFRKELKALLRRAKLPTNAPVHFWTKKEESQASARDHAYVYPTANPPEFHFSRRMLHLDKAHREAILAHEVGHVIAEQEWNDGSEDAADRAAREFLGVPICYDPDWPGKGVQVRCSVNKRRSNPSRRRANPKEASAEHLEDALQHASLTVDRDLQLKDFKISKPVVMSVEDLEQYDDLSSWAEFSAGELLEMDEDERWQALNSYRGSGFAGAAEEWIRAGEVPTIVVVRTEEDSMIGDGRGRTSVARGADLRVPVVILTERTRAENPAFVSPDRDTPSEAGFIYHATNEHNLRSIVEEGALLTHKPWEGTDQEEWPDGSTEKRSYWSERADLVWQFAPEDGRAVIVRTPKTSQFRRESGTGDVYTTKKVPATKLEVLTDDGWTPVSASTRAENPKEFAVVPVDLDDDDEDDIAFIVREGRRDVAIRQVARAVPADAMVNVVDARVFNTKKAAQAYAREMAPRAEILAD